ncbi:MAG: MDR family MFS transporter [Desulfitobacteriaceae bacterium]|nr:MDR family MFS transporter [Desulfitobacteriaceae bacterium]MDD4402617.1 MDR family MFS transporter [Desulfitobacteriaceae bacterium]
MESIDKKERSIIVSIILAGAFMGWITQSLLTCALPKIMTSLSISANKAQWLTTFYLMVLGVMIPLTAYLIDKFATRKIFIFCMAIFTFGSIIAAFSTNFTMLLTARILQAAGAGILMPLVQYVVLLLYPVEQRGTAMGMVGLVIGLAPALGSVISGLLVDSYGWNSIFYVLSLSSILNLIIAVPFLRNVGETREVELDIQSVVLSTIGFGALLFGFSTQGSYGFFNIITIMQLAIGSLALIWFVVRQFKLEQPLLDLRVFKDSAFTVSVILVMVVNTALISASILIPIYIQIARGYSALVSGVFMVPGIAIMAVLNPYTGYLMDKYGPRLLSIVGLCLLTLGTFGFSSATETTALILFEIMFTIRLIGVAMALMPLTTWGLNGLQKQYLSHGTAVHNTLRQVAGAIGSATIISIMTSTAQKASSVSAEQAQIYGINKAFFISGIMLVISVLLAILTVDKKSKVKLFQHH